MIEAFPLDWPLGFARTRDDARKWSQFKQTMENAQRFLRHEINLLGAGGLIVSSNIPVRRDGMFYTEYMNKKMDDPGVAIYFKMGTDDIVMCCDQYLKVWENIYALGKSVEALRAIERYGCSEFMKRAFTGFKAIPERVEMSCWEILVLPPTKDTAVIKERFRLLAMDAHPDKGGSVENFHALNTAYNDAMKLANSLIWHP